MPAPSTDETRKNRALAMLRNGEGLAAAFRATGVSKSTIRGWARQAGINTTAATDQATAQQTQAAVASAASRRQRIEDHFDMVTDRLIKTDEMAQAAQDAILAAQLQLTQEVGRAATAIGARIVHDTDGRIVLSDGDDQRLQLAKARLNTLIQGTSLREIVGTRTRAITDLLRLCRDVDDDPAVGGGNLTVVFASQSYRDMPDDHIWDLDPSTGKIIGLDETTPRRLTRGAEYEIVEP